VRLLDKVALITGAASGLARAWAEAFAREGADVVVADIDETGGAEVVAGLAGGSRRAIFLPMDVSVERAVRDGVAAAEDAFGRLDVLCNGAGIMDPADGPVTELSIEVWNRILAVNLTGAALVSKYAVPLMRSKGGSIINTSSAVAIAGASRSHAYVAAKGGVLALTRAMAAAYARFDIRVNAICPGIVETPMTTDLFETEEARRRGLNWHLLRRFGTVDDVAPLAVYLASDESRWMTGAALSIDGGATAT
jgi:NAD(P)-dependent dehydrogenase (short-subunit alcohol dehydrogenase family)